VLFHPCASLSLHLHQVVKGTCTPKLLNLFGTQQKALEDFLQRFAMRSYRVRTTYFTMILLVLGSRVP
jgi:hypothetical protein